MPNGAKHLHVAAVYMVWMHDVGESLHGFSLVSSAW